MEGKEEGTYYLHGISTHVTLELIASSYDYFVYSLTACFFNKSFVPHPCGVVYGEGERGDLVAGNREPPAGAEGGLLR